MKFADLHLHTRYSDGTYTPADLVRNAVRHGLSVIALTDHDTLEGCGETAAAAAAAGLTFIHGTEITAEFDGLELHILGYYVDPAHPALAHALAHAQNIRQERVREMVARLHACGIPLPVEDVFDLAQCRAPGRPHLARALVARGFCRSLDDAFERFLKKDRPGWVPKEKIPAAQAIDLIHQASGVAVLAHPALNRNDALIDALYPLGLDGLECFHPKHNGPATQRYRAAAQRLNLAITGGSDCHGSSKNRPTMGTVKLPFPYFEALHARHQARTRPAPSPSPVPSR